MGNPVVGAGVMLVLLVLIVLGIVRILRPSPALTDRAPAGPEAKLQAAAGRAAEGRGPSARSAGGPRTFPGPFEARVETCGGSTGRFAESPGETAWPRGGHAPGSVAVVNIRLVFEMGKLRE